jgi:hypothetical protein
MESHVPRKLDTKMAEATNALHGDQVSTAQAGVAKSVVRRGTRVEERGGFFGPELVRNGSDATRFGDHHFRVSSIHGYSRYYGVLTIHDVAASAWLAHPVLAAEESDTDPLTDFPPGHSTAQGFNAASDFMPGNARQIQTRVYARDRGRIGVTDSACFDPNPNLTCSRLGDRPFHYSKHTGLVYFYGLVCVFHVNLLLDFTVRPQSTRRRLMLHLPPTADGSPSRDRDTGEVRGVVPTGFHRQVEVLGSRMNLDRARCGKKPDHASGKSPPDSCTPVLWPDRYEGGVHGEKKRSK